VNSFTIGLRSQKRRSTIRRWALMLPGGNAVAAKSEHLSLDGALVSIEGEDLDFSLPWSGSIRCIDGSVRFGFQTAPKGTVDFYRVDHPDLSFPETYSYQGGTLHVGWGTKDDDYGYGLTGQEAADRMWIANWEGRSFSVFALARTHKDSPPDLVDWFDRVLLRETRSGVALEPRPGRQFEMFNCTLTKEIPGLGVVEIVSRRSRPSLVPAHRGTPVVGGELYFESSPPHFLLVGDTALSVIQPTSSDHHGSADELSALERTRVQWLVAEQGS
jgi:hypothetical protein